MISIAKNFKYGLVRMVKPGKKIFIKSTKMLVHKNKNGFTLLELLVVVAILGILLSMLLPSLTKARELSRNAICISNVYQMGAAAFAYTKDNSGRFPSSNAYFSGRMWVGRKGTNSDYYLTVTERPINSYLGYNEDGIETPIVVCPSMPDEKNLNNYLGKGTTYYGNEHHRGWEGIGNYQVAKVNNPTKVVVMRADGTDSRCLDAGSIWWRTYHKRGKSIYPFSFVDGSASFKEAKAKEGILFEEGDFILDINLDK